MHSSLSFNKKKKEETMEETHPEKMQGTTLKKTHVSIAPNPPTDRFATPAGIS